MLLMGFLHEHFILPFSDLIRGEQVHKYLRLLREAEQWTDSQMSSFQQQRLRKLLTYAAEEVPFYREWFVEQNLNPDAVLLNQLPVVDKSFMRQVGTDRFSAVHFPARDRRISRSGGSTGEPFSFYETRLSYSVNMAAKLRTWYQAGYCMGDRYMKITNGVRTNRLKALQDIVNNCIYVPFYSITDDTLLSILQKIDSLQPQFIRSYPAPLYLLAKYRRQHPGYHHCPRHIFTTGSSLPKEYRDEIEQSFGCDVIDSFSCEGTPNTYETLSHDGYHVTGYYGMIEVLDEENHPVTNGIGRVISTDLWNYAYPFIRYDTQDLVEVVDGRIVRIMGRECETLLEAGGSLLTVHNFTHYFSDNYPSVDGWQVVKQKDGNIRFRLVVNNLFSFEDERRLVNHWSACLKKDVSVEIVDELPLLANNKHRSIIDES